MENAEKIDISGRPSNEERNGIGGASCGFWIFGNEKSADNDMKEKFEVVDDEKKD